MDDEILDSPERRNLLMLMIFLLLFAKTAPAKARWRHPDTKAPTRRADCVMVYCPAPYLPWLNIANDAAFTVAPGAWIDVRGIEQWLFSRIESVERQPDSVLKYGTLEVWKVGYRVAHVDPDPLPDFRRSSAYPPTEQDLVWRAETAAWVRDHQAKVGDLLYGVVNLMPDDAADQRRRIAAGECGRNCRGYDWPEGLPA